MIILINLVIKIGRDANGYDNDINFVAEIISKE